MRLGRVLPAMTSWLLLAGLLSLAPGVARVSADERAWERYMANGERAYQEGRYASAEGWFLDAVREAEDLDPKGQRLVQSLKSLAEAYRKQGKQGQAESALRRAGPLSGQPPTAETAGPDVLVTLEKYVAFLREIGREQDAGMVEMRVQRMREVRAGGSGSKLLYFNPVAELRDYALLLRERNREAEAKVMEAMAAAEARKLVQRYQRLGQGGSFGSSDPHFAWPEFMIGGIEALEGRLYPEAQGLFEAAVKGAEKFGPTDVRLAKSLSLLAYAHAAQHDAAAVDRLAQRALPILEKAAGSGHSMLASSLEALALSHLRFDFQPAKSLAYFQRALPILEKDLVADHPVIGLHMAGLAACRLALSQPEQAKPHLERALVIAARQFQREHIGLAIGLDRVADLYMEQRNYAQADAVARRVLAVLQKMLDPEHPDVVRVRQKYAVIAREMNRQAPAKASVFLDAPTSVQIHLVQNLTLLHATFNRSQRAVLIVDTGASLSLITPLLLTRLGLSIPKDAPRREVSVVGGQRIEVPLIIISSLQVGDARVENLEVAVSEVALEAPEIGGLLGGDVLHRFRITLDKNVRRMILEPLPQ